MKNKNIAAFINYATIILSNGVNILLTIFVLRIYDVDQYAVYSLITAIIAIFIMFDLGLSNSVVKFLSKHKNHSRVYKVLNSYFLYFLLLLLLIFSIIILISLNFLPSYLSEHFSGVERKLFMDMFLISIFIIFINIINKYLTGLLSSREKFIPIKLLNFLRVLLRFIIVIIFIYFKVDIILFIYLDLLLSIFLNLLLTIINFNNKTLKYKFEKINKVILYSIFYHALFIFLISVMDIVFWKLGQIIIGGSLRPIDVSIYSITMLMVQVLLAFNSVLNSIIYPYLSKISNNLKLIKEVYQDSLRYQSKIMIFLITFIIICSLLYFDLVFGKDFLQATHLFIILSVPLYIMMSQSSVTFILYALGKHKFRAILLFISALSLVLTTLLLVSHGIYWVTIILALHLLVFNILILNIYYFKVIGITPGITLKVLLGENRFNIIISVIVIILIPLINHLIFGNLILLIYLLIFIVKNRKFLLYRFK